MNRLFQVLKQVYNCANERGIKIPLLYDPISKAPSVTLSMMVMSFTVCIIGNIGKITNLIGPVDLTQSSYLFLMTMGAYLGRRIQSNGTTKSATLDTQENK